jgi:hypothetical protein
VLKVSKKNFEVPTRSSLPGFTAIHDSDRFELYAPGLQVPGSGLVCPGGTGYPPPAVGELATAFVPTKAHESAWAAVVTTAASRSVPIEIQPSALFTIVPPFDSRSCVGENRFCPTRARAGRDCRTPARRAVFEDERLVASEERVPGPHEAGRGTLRD